MTRLDFSFDKPSLKTNVTKWSLQAISPPDRANNTRWFMNLQERGANLQRPGTELWLLQLFELTAMRWAELRGLTAWLAAVVKKNEGLLYEYELYTEKVYKTLPMGPGLKSGKA